MITHKKTSAVANTDAGKVGGDDWNDPHVHGLGEIITAHVVQYEWTETASFYCPFTPPTLARPSAGRMQITFPARSIDVPTGCTLRYWCIQSLRPYAALPAGSYLECTYVPGSSSDVLTVQMFDSSDTEVDFAVYCLIAVTVYAEVVAV